MSNKWKNIDPELIAKPITLKDIEHISFTDRQNQLMLALTLEISKSISDAKYLLQENFDPEIFSRPLIWLEREASSIIEGSMTLFEDQSSDYIADISDSYSWEDRNLYEIYTKHLLKNANLDKTLWSKFFVSNIHSQLYDNMQNNPHFIIKDFKPEAIIKKIQPGIIQTSDDIVIAHGVKEEKPNIYFIQPSKKEHLLDDLMNTIKTKLNSNDSQDNVLTLSDIAKFHVIFEGIHPFKDGNGRIGRVLMAMLFNFWCFFTENIPIINLSEYFNEHKDTYYNLLRTVQLDPFSKENWYQWNIFFVKAMLETKKRQVYRINEIAKLYKEIILNPQITSSPERKYFLKAFFKYYKLNRTIEIKKFEGKKSSKALYNDFNLVVDILGAKETQKGTFDFVRLREILRKNHTDE